jgi:hypothetical protein
MRSGAALGSSPCTNARAVAARVSARPEEQRCAVRGGGPYAADAHHVVDVAALRWDEHLGEGHADLVANQLCRLVRCGAGRRVSAARAWRARGAEHAPEAALRDQRRYDASVLTERPRPVLQCSTTTLRASAFSHPVIVLAMLTITAARARECA